MQRRDVDNGDDKNNDNEQKGDGDERIITVMVMTGMLVG